MKAVPPPTPQQPSLTTPSPRPTRPAGRARAQRPGPGKPYTVHEFLDDHRRFVSTAAEAAADDPATIPLIDGRMLVLHTELVDEQRPPRAAVTDPSHLERFRQVLEFLERWRYEIAEAGLATDSAPMAVREEFVRYLLRCDTAGDPVRIPRCVLLRFLDEWGHRWM